MSDDLWLPTPTVMDATRHTVRGCWRRGENWRGVALVNAILDAGEIRIMGTHTTGMSENELPGTPNCMDAIAPRDGAALERVLRRGDRDGSRRDSTGNLREDVMMDDVDMMPTPRASDVKGRNQRNDQTCMTGTVEQGTRAIPAPGPYHGGLWGLDDGRGVRFGRFAAAIRRWERVSGRPAPCPTQATGGLRRWVGANADDPTLFEPYWLARHAPFDAHPKARLDQPMRDRMLARWRETDRGMSLIDPMFWPGCKDMDPDIPIPATRLPDKSVLDYWKTRSVGSRFPSAAHLSPRFVEWMMGLEDGWVTNPAIWRHVDGNHRNLQLRALGNGVVPPQAAMAVDWALRVRERLAV